MNQLTEYRREFHKYPENGWREFRTSARVAEILTGMGYDVAMGPDVIEPGSVGEPERLSEEQIRQEMERAVRQGADPAFVKRTQGWPGVMAVLDTGREGPVSAMRFEMDCLPYDEPQRPGYRPCDEGYLSCNPQSVHACGHDGHTAIGLGIAAELMKRKGELKGKIKLFFQPAEETFYGAQSIVDKGHLDDVMNFIAVHIALSAENKPLPSHTVACGCRDFLSDRQLDVYLEGKAAHPCGASQEGKNALLAACSAALNIHSIAPHEEGLCRVNVGEIHAGVECHDMAQCLIGLGNQLNILWADVHVLLKKYRTDVFLHPFGLVSRLPGHVLQNLLYALSGISRIIHDDPAHRDAFLPLRPAEDVQKQLLLVRKMIANHFLQREKALEWHSVVGNLLDKVTLRPLRGDDQISLVNQLSICLDDGIPMYIQLSGQLSLCRHLVARAELPR